MLIQKPATKSCKSLAAGKLWIGSVGDVTTLVEKEQCRVIVDLRAEKVLTGREHPEHYLHYPLVDGKEDQDAVIQEAVETLSLLMQSGYKVALHCSDGGSRTGCIAIGVLLRIGLASTLEQALELFHSSCGRSAAVHPHLLASLKRIYTT